ncbi:MAG: PilZ domain-containing protein [bacterium]|nr:PilZ domain-containing protein [bacterium]
MNLPIGHSMEQRRNSRIQKQFAALLENLDTAESTTGRIEDISANGVRVTLSEENFAQEGHHMRVSFECEELHFEENVVLEVFVRSIWTDKAGDTNLGLQAEENAKGLKRLEETWLALMFDEIHKDDDISYF